MQDSNYVLVEEVCFGLNAKRCIFSCCPRCFNNYYFLDDETNYPMRRFEKIIQNIDAYDIKADYMTILSKFLVSEIIYLYDSLNVFSRVTNIYVYYYLNVRRTTNLYNSFNVQGVNILNSINNLNSVINNNVSTLNINASKYINFNINDPQSTQVGS